MNNNKTVSKKRSKFITSKSKRKVKINRRSKRKSTKRKSTKRKSTKRKYRKKKIMKGGRDINSFIADPEKYYTQFKIDDTLTKDKLKSLFNVSSYIGDGDTQLILFEDYIKGIFYFLFFDYDILTLEKVNGDTKMLEMVWKIITENYRIQTIQVSFKADPDTYYTQFKIGDTLTKDKDDLKKLFEVTADPRMDKSLMLFNDTIGNDHYELLFKDNILTLYKKNYDSGKLEIVWEIITTEDDKIENILVYNDNISI